MTKNVLLLYPHQLFSAELLPANIHHIIMVEDPVIFGTDKANPLFVHKQKLVLHRASMRRYVEEVLWPAGYEVDYIESHQIHDSTEIVNKLSHADSVQLFDVNDDVLDRKLSEALQGLHHAPEIVVHESPSFYLSAHEVKSFLLRKGSSDFESFYRWQRERFNILIDSETYRPVGGKLSFELEVRKPLPKNTVPPSFQVFGSNRYVDDAKKYVLEHFADNVGSVDDVPWPTNQEEALQWVDSFIENRLRDFCVYEDAIDGQAPWLYHSAVSALLNIGLITPPQVVGRALAAHAKTELPLASLESFIRQIVGWREYIRGMYLLRHVQLRTENPFAHNRNMTNDWYFATTGLPPVDDVIKKVIARGYTHNAEREMLCNIMMLSDIAPDDIYRWFMESFVDAYDWMVVPIVYGICQGIENDGIRKPMVSSSNYIRSMSHYEKGGWCDVWDGLYWRFIEKNKAVFASNPHMKVSLQQLTKVDADRRRIVAYRAEDFLKHKTTIV